jgi:uracil-DNA glycosylase
MDAHQESQSNPFGMDEACQNCPALAETRERVVHGYGDVGADFAFVGVGPGPAADATGVPFADDRLVFEVIAAVGLTDADPHGEWPDADAAPDLEDVFLTQVARCHHPDREATDEEVRNCEPYLSSEVRMINPEIIVPVGQRALEALAFEYTTMREADLDAARMHASPVRGRGFELLPMLDPADQDPADSAAFVEQFAEILETDYRQTKGRRGSLESGRGPDDR